jgi:hypothetical protein
MTLGDPPKPDNCPVCGANYGLVGRAHHCKPLFVDPGPGSAQHPARVVIERFPKVLTKLAEDGDVNEVNMPQAPELTQPVKKKRGEYPGTDERRKYMREYMMKKRRGKR